MSELPDRPFTSLPPPADGARQAVRAGRRRRDRRRLGAAGGAVVVAAVAVLALGQSSGTSATDRLVPTDDLTPTATATPVATGGPASPPPPSPAPSAVVTAQVAYPAAPTAEATSSASRVARPTTSLPPYQAGALERTYQEPVPAGARVCSGTLSNDSGSTRARLDWCIQGSAADAGTGHLLSVQVCRDQTTDAQLTFPGALEADLVVSRGGTEVWRWSTGQPSGPAHQLATPAGACWSWSYAYPDVDGAGRSLEPGSYAFQASSAAQELAQLPDSQPVTFTVT